MKRISYITPAVEIVSVKFDTSLCVLATSPDPYEENGDYDWGTP